MQSYQNYNPNNKVAYAAPGSSPNAPNATPGSQQASGGGGGGIANFKTPAFLLKIVSVFFGLIAMSVALHGYFNGLWYHQTFFTFLCDTRQEGFQICQPDDHSLEKICHEGFNKQLKDRGVPKEMLLTCPTRWLVTPQVFIIAFVWLGTFIVLLVLLTVDVTKNKSFHLLDMIGHLAAGILTIVSGSCLIGFASELLDGDNCEQNPRAVITSSEWMEVDLGGIGGPRQAYYFDNSTKTSTTSTTTISSTLEEEIRKNITQECQKELKNTFQHWHILSGGIFAFITGVLYILIGILAVLGFRDKKNAQNNNQPMGVGQGSMTPSQAQMQQAHPSQTVSMPNSESPSQAPGN